MALTMGLGGTLRAVDAGSGTGVAAVTNVYVGLLSTLPADPDTLTLSALVTGNEFNLASFYVDDRKVITLPAATIVADVATITYAGADVTWTNSTVGDVVVNGIFLTDASTGTSGDVLWVGAPDAGGVTFGTSEPVTVGAGDLVLKVD